MAWVNERWKERLRVEVIYLSCRRLFSVALVKISLGLHWACIEALLFSCHIGGWRVWKRPIQGIVSSVNSDSHDNNISNINITSITTLGLDKKVLIYLRVHIGITNSWRIWSLPRRIWFAFTYS